MKGDQHKRSASWTVGAAAVGTYAVLGSALLLAASLYNGITDFSFDFNSRRVIALAVVSACGLIIGLFLLSFAFLASRDDRTSEFWLPLTANAVMFFLSIGVVEIALRVIAQPDPLGTRLGSTVLIPYDWDRVAETNMMLYERSLRDSAYYVGDDTVGWTVGSSRLSADGLYASSEEGLRSAVRGQSYAAEPFEHRVSMFGDSFVFSEEVVYEDSLAFHLDNRLDSDVQLLNFGVPGYGIDQAFLRYRSEGQHWDPDVVVLAFVQDDLNRAANVYTFLKPGWGIPFSKPRYVLRGQSDLTLLNVPNIQPPEMYGKRSVFELPHLEEDMVFFGHAWRESVLHSAYVFRFLTSIVPRWHIRTGSTSEEAIARLGENLIAEFLQLAEQRNAEPLIVYFPSRGDFTGQDRTLAGDLLGTLADRGIEVIDVRDCGVNSVDRIEHFVTTGVHYNGEGNSLAAACLAPRIRALLPR